VPDLYRLFPAPLHIPFFSRVLVIWLLIGFDWHHAYGQGLALLDDFNRANSPTVGKGWTEVETSGPGSVTIAGNQLRLSSATAGRDYAVRDVSSRYSPVLNTNSGRPSRARNTQQSRPNPSGFDATLFPLVLHAEVAGELADFQFPFLPPADRQLANTVAFLGACDGRPSTIRTATEGAQLQNVMDRLYAAAGQAG